MTEAPKPCILIADDQPDILEALRLLLKGSGFQAVSASSAAGALSALSEREFDVALIDLNYARDTTSGKEGLDLLGSILAHDATLPVVVMTAWATIDGAVDAMKRGARDYVQKPWDNARLLATLKTQVELSRSLRRSRRLESESARARAAALPSLVATSKAMEPVLRLVDRVGPSEANVLITGGNGTGKEVIARLLHSVSQRKDQPFVALNAGGLGEGIFESELFGHVKGAFTDAKADRIGCFELADGGTLFLDEIGNMPISQQAKLLRVLQTGEFTPVGSSRVRHANVRVLSATNADVHAEVSAGKFREDLLYRLNTVEIHLPALADRKEDIPPLADRFLAAQAGRYQRQAPSLSPAALRALMEHAWPGNVRELEHVMERAFLLSQGGVVQPEDLGLRTRKDSTGALEEMTLEEVERTLVHKALARAGGNVSVAAKSLGLSRSAFYRRMEQFGLKGGAG